MSPDFPGFYAQIIFPHLVRTILLTYNRPEPILPLSQSEFLSIPEPILPLSQSEFLSIKGGRNMKQENKTTTAVIAFLAVMFLLLPLAAQAGNLEPSGPPTAGTMHTLEDIYQKLLSIEGRLTSVESQISRFKDNGDGTVTDNRTGLVWLKNANPCGKKTWYDAVAYCSSLASGTAGLTDGSTAGQWRLPSKVELENLGTDPPAAWQTGFPSVAWIMPGAPFRNFQFDIYWSSTTYESDPLSVWYVYMGNGYAYMTYKSDNNYVWPVRYGN
jgi:hypothetical protein